METYKNLQKSLLGLHCNDPKFIAELSEVQRYYDFYEGRPFMLEDDSTVGKGQLWPVKDRDYKPTREVRNITRKLMNKQGRFMTSNAPTLVISSVDVENREKLDEKRGCIEAILDECKFWNKFSKAFMDATIGKRVLLTVGADSTNNNIKLRFFTMNEFTYEYDPLDADKLIRVQIAYQDENTVGMLQQDQRWYKWIYEMRENGHCWCKYEVVDGTNATAYVKTPIYNDGELKETFEPIKQEWDTGLEELPCKVIFNDGLTGDLRGRSDIKDLMDLAMNYNKTMSDYRDALRFKMFEQPVFIDADSNSIESIKIAPNALIDLKSDPALGTGGTMTSTAKASMLSSTFSFQATADSYLKQLKNDMYEIMEQPLPDQISNVPSGKALKMIYYDLICRCEDKWKTWDEVLLWLVHMIEVTVPMYGLCRHIPGIETLTIQSVNTWKHNYPIPDDEIDNKNLAISEVQANVRSHKSYIEEFSNSEDADKEFDTIIKEMTEINESNNSSLGLDDFNDEPDVDDE